MQTPIFVMNAAPERQSGRKAQISNITAAKTVADVIRTCLGPKAMLKMILDPMGGILLTNDGNAILREIDVAHPAAKNMIELSRTQDEECGDGTTSVIVLAGEILAQSLSQLELDIHPVVIISAYNKALKEALEIVKRISTPIDVTSDEQMLSLIKTSIGTKFVVRWSDLMCKLALQAVRVVAHEEGGQKTVDIKRYARVEKVPGGEIEDSRVLNGVMLNKDITHPHMRRRIKNPRIVLLDCPLEYKKGESQTNMEFSKETDWARAQQIEEEQVIAMANKVLEFKPDLIITEKGISDLAQHVFSKNNISAIRRVRKSDNNRIALAVGATIVNRVEDLRESDVGTQCGLFRIEKIGDEYFTFLDECNSPKACTILLRGPSKDILNEIERNLQDAMSVARNVVFNPLLAPGGGATEMAISVGLHAKARSIGGVEAGPFRAVADAMEVIPRTLAQNSGGNVIRVLTELRAKHAIEEYSWGINGETGKPVDMKEYGLYESASVKIQTYKTAIEAARMLLRVDDVVQAIRKEKDEGGSAPVPEEMMDG
ncbi:Chaperonin Cpn60/TCP-1 family [Amanita muscaria]